MASPVDKNKRCPIHKNSSHRVHPRTSEQPLHGDRNSRSLFQTLHATPHSGTAHRMGTFECLPQRPIVVRDMQEVVEDMIAQWNSQDVSANPSTTGVTVVPMCPQSTTRAALFPTEKLYHGNTNRHQKIKETNNHGFFHNTHRSTTESKKSRKIGGQGSRSHICFHIYTCNKMSVHIHSFTHTHILARTHTHTYKHTHTYTNIHTHIHAHISSLTFMPSLIHIQVCIHTQPKGTKKKKQTNKKYICKHPHKHNKKKTRTRILSPK